MSLMHKAYKYEHSTQRGTAVMIRNACSFSAGTISYNIVDGDNEGLARYMKEQWWNMHGSMRMRGTRHADTPPL